MSYWPQQLNFTVWCATTGCGISDKDHSTFGFRVKFSRLFHHQANTVSAGQHSEHKCFAWRSNFQSGKQQVRLGFIQEDMQ